MGAQPWKGFPRRIPNMQEEDILLVEKYVVLIMDEYMSYITWDKNLSSDDKATRKSVVQSLRKLL